MPSDNLSDCVNFLINFKLYCCNLILRFSVAISHLFDKIYSFNSYFMDCHHNILDCDREYVLLLFEVNLRRPYLLMLFFFRSSLHIRSAFLQEYCDMLFSRCFLAPRVCSAFRIYIHEYWRIYKRKFLQYYWIIYARAICFNSAWLQIHFHKVASMPYIW